MKRDKLTDRYREKGERNENRQDRNRQRKKGGKNENGQTDMDRKKGERKERGENETCSTILNDDAKTQTTIMPSLTCTVVTFSH